MIDWWSSRRVVVTGGNGFLGRHVMQLLAERQPAFLTTFSRADYELTKQVDVARMYADLKPDIVIHIAGLTGGIGASRDSPGQFFYENAMMGIELLEQARRHGVAKFVQIGTVCSYPKYAPVPMREETLWDGYPEETNGAYGIAKKALLVQAQAYWQQYGLHSIHLLMANLYGPGDNFDPTSSHVIPALIRKCIEARDARASGITVWGSGTPTREFLFVDDAARGILLAAEKYDKPDPVNLGTSHEISIRELVRTIARVTGFSGEIRWDASYPDGQPRRKLDIDRARREFGFSAQVGLDQGLQSTLDWYEAQRPHRSEVTDQ